jgi:hypothetical protein
MSGAGNARFIAQAAATRSDATRQRATTAIETLDRTGRPVTFSTVAAAAGVSRAWLYRQPDLRAAIVSLRAQRPAGPATPAAQHATIDSLRQRLDAAREEIARLRAENTALRDETARRLGRQRAQQAPGPINQG